METQTVELLEIVEKPRQEVHCWDIIKCTAQEYLICPAYLNNLNCFQVIGKPCCKRNDIKRCEVCPVYRDYHRLNDLPLPKTDEGRAPNDESHAAEGKLLG